MPKVPKEVGAAVDMLMTLRAERRRLQAEVDLKKEDEDYVEEQIFTLFDKAKLEGARGRLAQASIKRSDVPTLEDWDRFAAHVVKEKALDLLQRRLSVEACRDRWSRKEAVPGVGVFTKISLSLTALKK
jgi:hypothetical protein